MHGDQGSGVVRYDTTCLKKSPGVDGFLCLWMEMAPLVTGNQESSQHVIVRHPPQHTEYGPTQ